MTDTEHSPFDSEFFRADNGRWVWEVYPNDGSPTVLAHGRSRYWLFAVIGLRLALRRLNRTAAKPIWFLPVHKAESR